MNNLEIPKKELKLLFSDILKGFCIIGYQNKQVKIKHLTYFDIADFDIKYQEYFEEAKRGGAPTIEDREQYLIEEGSWSIDKNNQIRDNLLFITNMKETKTKLFRQAEIEQINRTIKETEEKVKTLENERTQLLQFTAESFANKKITEYQIFKSFILDDSAFFTQDEFDALTDIELADIVNLYNDKFIYFNERNFKRIALSSFFLNSFYLCKDNPFIFYGKPIVQLTMFQVEIFGHATFFKHILSNSDIKPPNYIMEDPQLLIDWHQGLRSVKEQHLDKGRKAEDLVGLNNKDREMYGINPSNDPHSKLIAAAQKKGAPLTAQEIMRLQGVL